MQDQQQIFRQAALDKLSSPEQLDQLMQVTSPRSWMALTAFGVLLLTAVVWGIMGSIPTFVQGRGILIKQGGVLLVTGRGEGHVLKILVAARQSVTNGQVIALIMQPELEVRKKQAEITQQRLQQELEDLLKFHTAEREAERADLRNQETNYIGMISDYGQQVAALETRVSVLNGLLGKGLVSEAQLLDIKNTLYAARHDQARINVQLKQLQLTQLQSDGRRRQEETEKRSQILQGDHQLELLRRLHELNSQVTSGYSGEILEVMVKEGQLISANTPIASLQAESKRLEARLYVSAADGKRVEKGMRVHLSPLSAKKEEFGLLLGEVQEVSQFPETPQGMLRVLENSTLVSDLSQGGAPIEVGVTLLPDPDTASGFEWTSQAARSVRLSSGTLCEGTITVDKRRPISFMLPILRRHLGT